MEQFARITRMVGSSWIECLQNKKVAVFGLGGVGSYVVEALVRNGIGELVLVDHDIIDITNLNRQLYALHSTIGMNKVDVARARCLDINPNLKITTYQQFYLPDQGMETIFEDCDFVVDAIDTVSGKIALVMQAKEHNTPIICSMGAGNKMDPTAFEVSDIYKTSVDPLARVMRYELKKRKVRKLKVVYSKEIPIKPMEDTENSCKHNCVCPPGTERKCTARRQVPGSNAFVPSTVGLIIAGEVIKDLIKK